MTTVPTMTNEPSWSTRSATGTESAPKKAVTIGMPTKDVLATAAVTISAPTTSRRRRRTRPMQRNSVAPTTNSRYGPAMMSSRLAGNTTLCKTRSARAGRATSRTQKVTI